MADESACGRDAAIGGNNVSEDEDDDENEDEVCRLLAIALRCKRSALGVA